MPQVYTPIDCNKDFAVMVGRYGPLHFGHMAVIDSMVGAYGTNCALFIGSCNAPISYRHLFSFEDRLSFIRTCYPSMRVAGLPDFPESDSAWLTCLDSLLELAGVPLAKAVFYGGSREDIEFFITTGRQVEIMNRFDGTTPMISATQVRDALIEGRSIEKLVHPKIIEAITYCFPKRWQELKRR